MLHAVYVMFLFVYKTLKLTCYSFFISYDELLSLVKYIFNRSGIANRTRVNCDVYSKTSRIEEEDNSSPLSENYELRITNVT